MTALHARNVLLIATLLVGAVLMVASVWVDQLAPAGLVLIGTGSLAMIAEAVRLR